MWGGGWCPQAHSAHSSRLPLLKAVAEAMLDGSAPAVCLPFLTETFQRCAPPLVHSSTESQVCEQSSKGSRAMTWACSGVTVVRWALGAA